MPYKKFYRRRRRPRRFKKSRSNMHSYASMAKTALKTAKFIKDVINVESKYCDHAGNTTYGTTMSVTLLNDPAQGTGVSNRTGDSIKNKSLTLNYSVRGSTNEAASDPTFVDMYLIYTKDSGVPTASDLFDQPTIPWISTRKIQHLYDWKIVSARHLILSKSNSKWNFNGTFYLKLSNHTRFNPAAQTIDDGAYYLAIISSDNTYPPTVQWNSRFKYYDN